MKHNLRNLPMMGAAIDKCLKRAHSAAVGVGEGQRWTSVPPDDKGVQGMVTNLSHQLKITDLHSTHVALVP